MLNSMILKMKQLEFVSRFDFKPSVEYTSGLLAAMEVRPALVERIGLNQRKDASLVSILEQLEKGERSSHLDRYSRY